MSRGAEGGTALEPESAEVTARAAASGPSPGRESPFTLVGDLTRKSGSSFYYAFLLLPREKREAIYAIYALSREIDDAVDEAADPASARARLAFWEEEVERLASGAPRHPILCAVARARARFPIPIAAMRSLLEGARLDLEKRRYASFEELRGYCERVASSIGLMCIEIFGYRGARTTEYAVNLGIALQLTNILRDLGQDAARGRLYVPRDEIDRFGARIDDLLAGRRTPEATALLAFQAARAKEYYAAAEEARDPRDRRSLLAAEVMRRIYRRLLAEIERSGFDVFERRIRLSRARRAGIALSTWLGTALGR